MHYFAGLFTLFLVAPFFLSLNEKVNAMDLSVTKFTLCDQRFDAMMNKVCTVSNEPNSCLKSESRLGMLLSENLS